MAFGIHQAVFTALEKKFVFSGAMAHVLTLALAGQKNAIVFGPAGHGKSQMVQAVMDALKLDYFTQFFGEGMDEARLFGGLDFKKFNEEHVLEYQADRSFLAHDVAVFEEVFDAPASVLLALKDTLTAGMLRNGPQQVPSKCKTIIALTNREPKEISELGPAAHALIERFPLQMSLTWPSYKADDYLAMFDRVAGKHPINDQLACIVADEEAGFVSPRTAMHALQVVKTSAGIRHSSKVEDCDLSALAYIPGLETLTKQLSEKLELSRESSEIKEALRGFESRVSALVPVLKEADTPIKALKVAKELSEIADKISTQRVTDELAESKSKVLEAATSLCTKAQGQAMSLTRI